MTYKNLRKELIDQNLKVSKLAESIGYSSTHVSGVISGRLNSPKAKKMISLFLKKDFDYLWSAEPTDQSKTPA